MNEKKTVRIPTQSRSIQMKEKIKNTALLLFCEKGYHHTSTNEIAKTARISIGSLYSYFPDKESILAEILREYDSEFQTAFECMKADLAEESCKNDPLQWITRLLEHLTRRAESVKSLNQELRILYTEKPEVAAVMDRHAGQIRGEIDAFVSSHWDMLELEDVSAVCAVASSLAQAVVIQIVFGREFEKEKIEKRRILDMGAAAIHKFLFT